jgi:PPK2 family polyphosphate:nucleotide phosphotransferase
MEGLAYAVKPGEAVHLDRIDAGHHGGLDRATADARLAALNAELASLQELLAAAASQAVLVVLQGLDTAGKDGTIGHVMSNVNPQGCQVVAFKTPTPQEATHDFLWRVHQATPARGLLTIFNRSHYEDVLVVRVHELVPREVWERRYEQINQFESLLASSGTIVVKFYLHITKDEQEKRLLAREEDKDKAWKLSAADWVERRYWDAYMAAYEDALARCSTHVAPWYIVPANHKWFRNLAIAQTLVDTLRPHEGAWRAALEERGRAALAALRQMRGAEGKQTTGGSGKNSS